MRTVMLVTLCLLTVVPSQATTTSSADVADDFIQGINKRISEVVPPDATPFLQLPDAKKVVETVKRSDACRMAVGGAYAKFAVERLGNTSYYLIWVMSARHSEDDRVQALLGYALIDQRSVVLLQPFMRPTAAKTERMPDGSVETMDLLPYMERALNLKQGSLTPSVLHILTILHEQAHLNDSIPRDDGCMAQSMLNTRYLAEMCMPELLPDSVSKLTADKITANKPPVAPNGQCSII